MNIGIDSKRELFKWGPIDGKLIYPDFFDIAFVKFHKLFPGYSWPDILGLYKSGKMSYIFDRVNLAHNGKKTFQHFILNDCNFKKYYHQWKKIIDDLLVIQEKVFKGVKDFSDQELAVIYQKWSEKYLEFWALGLVPELGNYGAEPWLKNLLIKQLPEASFVRVFEKLCAPEELSFYQQADLELLQLYKFRSNPKLLNVRLKKHQAKYPWILNSYKETRVLTVEYFRKELFSHSEKFVAKRINELGSWTINVRRSKKQIIKGYKISSKIAKIAERMAFCVSWQDFRKFYIFLANHYIDIFLKEITRRKKINFDDLHWYNHFEIVKLLEKGEPLPSAEIRRREKYLAVWYSEKANALKFISGKKAQTIIEEYSKENIEKKSELKGITVSQGKIIRARVRIIDAINKLGLMKKGEVLVSPMTSPDYIVAMRKASAIITDTGGMTSHAAIVSRELGISCIVGTKIATKVFKDGDMVEVDANKGIVRKL